MLFLSPPMTPPPRSGRWICHGVGFVFLDGHEHGDGRRPRPKFSAIFEYIQPRTIAIDTSCEAGCMLNVEMRKRFVSTVNASVGGNSFVDLYCFWGWSFSDQIPRSGLVSSMFVCVLLVTMFSPCTCSCLLGWFSNSEARPKQLARICKANQRKCGRK
jgi:hypothetical protein